MENKTLSIVVEGVRTFLVLHLRTCTATHYFIRSRTIRDFIPTPFSNPNPKPCHYCPSVDTCGHWRLYQVHLIWEHPHPTHPNNQRVANWPGGARKSRARPVPSVPPRLHVDPRRVATHNHHRCIGSSADVPSHMSTTTARGSPAGTIISAIVDSGYIVLIRLLGSSRHRTQRRIKVSQGSLRHSGYETDLPVAPPRAV